ncbi:MAG: prolipoprotein diacylglyceryl transferase [Desulfuromonadaceae bacterium]|nr:prolipoprotein diacylglyceryl transferase [Desulfuromonas sp.]MDY0186116.1 prolipoprotein diacylglyceryl transferase [Desulfuromonadaceae bacterium]
MLSFPNIDPIAFEIGPLAVRWYGLMYLAGFACVYFYLCRASKHKRLDISCEAAGDLLFAGVLGVVLGGRLGYVLFYNFAYYVHHPLEVLHIWEGGMSFHGGLLGVVVAVVLFCRKRGYAIGPIADALVTAACFGLFFGRIGNFINAELWGRVTDVPWSMVFPSGGSLPRHPSQLYQAVCEGPLLFTILTLARRYIHATWSVFYTFIAAYALFRFVLEFYREPDAHLGLVTAGLSMGQLLSIPMFCIGCAGVWVLNRKSIEKA